MLLFFVKFLKFIFIVCAALGAVLVAFSYVPGGMFCDLSSQLRIPVAVILIPIFISLLFLRSPIGLVIIITAMVANAIPIFSLFAKAPCQSKGERQFVSVLNFNTEFQHNDEYRLVESLLQERKPDIIAFVEINKTWVDAIGPFTKNYPYKKMVIEGPGLALLSKFPIEKTEVRKYGKSNHPRILATLRIGGKAVQVLVAHPTTPQSEAGLQERNAEMKILGDEISKLESPKILIGDLNCTQWSTGFKPLVEAGLKDSQQGFGPQPSWPARTGRFIDKMPIPPMVPIDHVLVSDDICVTNRLVGPPLQSDHLPVFVQLDLPR